MALFDSEKRVVVESTLAVVESNLEFYEEHGMLGIVTPHYDLDGDHIEFFLEEEVFDYKFTDLGLTRMRLAANSVDISERSKTRAKVFENILSNYEIQENSGMLEKRVAKEGDIGLAYLEFLIAIHKISDLSFTKRSFVRSIFMEEVHACLRSAVPDGCGLEKDWTDAEKDKTRAWPVDFRIFSNGRQAFCYAISSELKATEALACSMHYRFELSADFLSVGVFASDLDMENRKIHRCHNWLDKPIIGIDQDSLDPLKDWIVRFIMPAN
jgi:hypothetical protein